MRMIKGRNANIYGYTYGFKKESRKKKKNVKRKYKCSTVRRVCICCATQVIHKNDKNYNSKICKDCTVAHSPARLSPRIPSGLRARSKK